MVDVIVSRHFPYESLDPKKPGKVHGAMFGGRFYCSQECYDKLKEQIPAEQSKLLSIPDGTMVSK